MFALHQRRFLVWLGVILDELLGDAAAREDRDHEEEEYQFFHGDLFTVRFAAEQCGSVAAGQGRPELD